MNDPKRAGTPALPVRGRARPQALDLSEIVLTKTRTLAPELTMPLVIEPAIANVDLAAWARDNSE